MSTREILFAAIVIVLACLLVKITRFAIKRRCKACVSASPGSAPAAVPDSATSAQAASSPAVSEVAASNSVADPAAPITTPDSSVPK